MNDPQSRDTSAKLDGQQSHRGGIAATGSQLNQSTLHEIKIAHQARDAAVYLSELDPGNPSVLILRRVEVLLLIRNLMRRQALDCPYPHLSEQDWMLANQVDSIRKLISNLTGNQLAALKAFLGRDAELFLVGLEAKQRRYLAGALRRAAQSLHEPITRGQFRIARLNYKRWAAIGVVTILSLGVLGAGLVKAIRSWQKPNLALHRPVKFSSLIGSEYENGKLLVDGDTTNLGFHTKNEANPYATIDLGESKTFSKVIVHNRTDCCQERAIPLQIEVSDDGTKFQVIAERREVFEKWIAKDLNAKGRFVRLQLRAANPLHLAEVEIY